MLKEKLKDENYLKQQINSIRKKCDNQDYQKYSKNVTSELDAILRKCYREDHPEEIAKIEEDLKKQYRGIQYNQEFLNKLVDQEILADILLESERAAGQNHSSYECLLDKINIVTMQELSTKSKGGVLMYELLEEFLDELSMEDRDLIQKILGLPPYDNPITMGDIATEMKVSKMTISNKYKQIKDKLKQSLMEKYGNKLCP